MSCLTLTGSLFGEGKPQNLGLVADEENDPLPNGLRVYGVRGREACPPPEGEMPGIWDRVALEMSLKGERC